MHSVYRQPVVEQRRVGAALGNIEDIARDILVDDVPGRVSAASTAADTEALTLSMRVEGQPTMLADDLSLNGFDSACLRGHIASEKVSEAPFADETDAGRILLAMVVKPECPCSRADLRFIDGAERKLAARQLRAGHCLQEVGLVLALVRGPAQARAIFRQMLDARVVTRRDACSAQHLCVLDEHLKLDLSITQHVRIGGAMNTVGREEGFEDVVPVFGREVRGMELDAKPIRNALSILEVRNRGAVLSAIIFVPVLHEQPFDAAALFEQAQRGDGGVNATGHADNDGVVGRDWNAGSGIGHVLGSEGAPVIARAAASGERTARAIS